MRKLFFLLVLVSGMLAAQTPNATNTQTIGKFLKLSKVPLGLETDNVLVRGNNGIVKFVPRSQFEGGSGGTQGLQQILQNNNASTIGFQLKSGEPGEEYTYASFNDRSIFLSEDAKGLSINAGNFQIFENGVATYITKDYIQFSNGEKEFVTSPGIISYGFLNSRNNKLDFTALSSNNYVRLKLPFDKLSGDYTIATNDDIKLKEYTVATLPQGTKGDVAFVNDAASPAFLATVVGGGSAVVRVFHNGSNWIVQ